jgi:hypothetical protein
MVSSVSCSGRYFTIKKVADATREPIITTTIRVINVIELAKLFTTDDKVLNTYIDKRYMSRVVAKVSEILIMKMVSKDMMLLNFDLLDLTTVNFERDFDWSLTVKNSQVTNILDYHIDRCAYNELFTRFFIRKYNKIRGKI